MEMHKFGIVYLGLLFQQGKCSCRYYLINLKSDMKYNQLVYQHKQNIILNMALQFQKYLNIHLELLISIWNLIIRILDHKIDKQLVLSNFYIQYQGYYRISNFQMYQNNKNQDIILNTYCYNNKDISSLISMMYNLLQLQSKFYKKCRMQHK